MGGDPAHHSNAGTGAVMIQLNAVLVAFDFGETSQRALVYGQNLTRCAQRIDRW
jgi:hypothetical protein